MHIKSLTLTNWKGCTRSFELKPVTVVFGKNRAGKTAIAEAVRVGLIGYSPKHGKRNQDTFGFIGKPDGASDGSVAIQFSDELAVGRSWKKSKRGVSYECQGPEVLVPAIMLDFSVYLKMSGPDKMRYIFRQVDLGEEFTPTKLAAKIRAACKLDGWNEHHEEALDVVTSMLSETHQAVQKVKCTVQEWIEVFLSHVKKFRDSKEETAKSMAAIASGVSELAKLPAAFDEEAHKKLFAKYEQKTRELTLADQATQDNQEIQNKRKRIENELANLAPPAFPDDEQDPEALTWAERYESQSALLKERLKTATNNARLARDAEEALKTQMEEFDKETATVLEYDYCPTCHQAGEAWKASFEANRVKDRLDLSTKLDQIKRTVDELLRETSVLEAKIKESEQQDEKRAEILKTAGEFQKKLAEIKAVSDRRQHLELQREQSQLKPSLSPADRARLGDEVAALKQALDKAAEEQKAHAAALADRRRVEESKQARTKAEAGAAVASLALAATQKLQKEATTKALQGSREKASVWTRPILGFDVDFKDGEIGYRRGVTWIGFDYFSGIEDLLAVAGLSIALAPEGTLKIVLMDELGRFHPDLKAKILARAGELLAEGSIDQFIGLDVTPPTDCYSIEV